MPHHNLQLLLRPTPGGLHDYHNFLSAQADLSLRSEQFSDLVIFTPDGPVSCQQSLLAPLSPLLSSLLSSYPPYPGLVHTVLTPIKMLALKNILQIIYTGMISVRNRTDMEDVLAGLQVLGIQLPGLECNLSAEHSYTRRGTVIHPRSRQALDYSLPRMRKDVPENNNLARMNNIPLPFSALLLDQSTSSLHQSIVKLPSDSKVFHDMKPNVVSNLHPSTHIGLVALQNQQFEAFRCDECNKGFKHKKALEIHRIKDHDHFIVNPLFSSEAIDNDPEGEANDEISDNFTAIEVNPRTMKNNGTDTEIPPTVSSVSQFPLICTLCQAPLPSEWYRHPRRHKCPYATPRSVVSTSSVEQIQCSTPVPSTWLKKPSRHSCPENVAITTPLQDLAAMSTKTQATTSSAKKRSRSVSSHVSRKKARQFSCQACTDNFSSLVYLRTHYTVSHFWDRIAAKFATWGPRCYICSCTFPSSNHLVRHMGNFHCYVDQCLVEDGLQFISMETTIKLLSPECGLCDIKATSAELKSHLAYAHFRKELEREFPGEDSVHKSKRCDRCGRVFNSSCALIKHVGSFHDQVLKYAKSFITVDDVDKHYIPENNFAEGDEISGQPFEFEDEDTAPLSEWKPLSVPKISGSSAVEKDPTPTSKKTKTDEVSESTSSEKDTTPSPKKAKKDEVSESTSSEPIPAESPPLHHCPLTHCSRQCSSRKDLLVHLAMSHYLKELEKQFGAGCGGSHCAQCDMMLPSNKQVYLRHMAVEHEVVMTYVERDLAVDSVSRGTVGDQSGGADSCGEVYEQAADHKE